MKFAVVIAGTNKVVGYVEGSDKRTASHKLGLRVNTEQGAHDFVTPRGTPVDLVEIHELVSADEIDVAAAHLWA